MRRGDRVTFDDWGECREGVLGYPVPWRETHAYVELPSGERAVVPYWALSLAPQGGASDE